MTSCFSFSNDTRANRKDSDKSKAVKIAEGLQELGYRIVATSGTAEYLNKNNRSGVIFPEGTRSRTGAPKKFHRKGLQTLITQIPEAYVLPISINNSWKLQKNGMFPMPFGVTIKYELHPVLKVSEHEIETLIDTVETIITSKIITE